VISRSIFYLFGYDFFISYKWSDARVYAVRLREALVSRGLLVFLDSSDYSKGDHWREEGRRALHRSSRLLLVCSPEVHDSKAVLHEVEIFTGLARRILPIDIEGSLRSRESALSRLIPAEVLTFSEPSRDCLQHGPTEVIVNDVVSSFELIRQHVRRVRWLSAAVLVLAVTLMAAVAAGFYADGKRRDAEWRRLVAEGGRADATLNEPTSWATGLAFATAAAVSARRSGVTTPEEVRLALLRAVWLATPYRVLMSDARSGSRAAFTATSGRVLALDSRGMVGLVDPGSEKSTTLPLQNLGQARIAALSPDEQLIVTVSDTAVQIWNANGAPSKHLPVAPADLIDVMFTRDGRRVVTAGRDGAVLSWSVDRGDHEVIQPVGTPVLAVALSPVSETMIVVDDEPQARLVDLTTHATLATLDGGAKATRIVSAAFSRDGTLLVTGNQGEDVETWSVDNGKRLRIIEEAHLGEVSNVAYSPNGQKIVSAGFDGTVRLWPNARGRELILFGHSGPVTAATFSHDGRQVLSSSEDGTIRLWDAEPYRDGRFVIIEGQMRAACGHAISAAGDRVATVSGGGVIRISDTEHGNTVTEWRENETGIHSAVLSRDGSRIVIAPDHSRPLVRDVKSGAELATLPSCGGDCSVDFSPDGLNVIVAGTKLAEVRSIDGKTASPLFHGVKTYGATFTPKGARVATTGADGRVRICGLDGSDCTVLAAHTVHGDTVCFDGTGLLTVSFTNVMKALHQSVDFAGDAGPGALGWVIARRGLKWVASSRGPSRGPSVAPALLGLGAFPGVAPLTRWPSLRPWSSTPLAACHLGLPARSLFAHRDFGPLRRASPCRPIPQVRSSAAARACCSRCCRRRSETRPLGDVQCAASDRETQRQRCRRFRRLHHRTSYDP